MTDPTPLSSATQEVLKAACIHHGLFNEEIVQRRRMIAAVLRAAAEQAHPKAHIEDIDYVHQSYIDGWKDALDVILVIADELEAQQTEQLVNHAYTLLRRVKHSGISGQFNSAS